MPGRNDRRNDWETELETAVAAARNAGQILLDWAGRFSVQTKGPNDFVTEADFASQKAIRNHILRQFPGDEFVAEEQIEPMPGQGDTQASGLRRRWIVDPLDGTTNYVHRFPMYCVSIGLEVDGELSVGVIYDPIRRECFAGRSGGGATCNGVPIHVSRAAGLSESLTSGGLPTDIVNRPDRLAVFAAIALKSQSLRRIGSSALSLAYVAAGRIDAFWARDLNPWDCAAGVLLVREAGGNVTKVDGRTYDVNQPDLLASNGLVHEEMVDALQYGPPTG